MYMYCTFVHPMMEGEVAAADGHTRSRELRRWGPQLALYPTFLGEGPNLGECEEPAPSLLASGTGFLGERVV